jgi:hypothetical protein
MVRALPSAIPPKMYRHFATITVLLTLGIAMFAEGESREAAAAQSEPRETVRRDEAEVVKPPIARRPAEHRQRPHQDRGFDGFDPSFGTPMDNPLSSLATYTEVASVVSQAGYSDRYFASLDAEERALLLDGLAKEGLTSPAERERKTAALIAASEARSGGATANY